ncbi:MAG: hypothetical protein MUF03_06920 [Rubrivivax sp.]|jgi:hypothetical protein|nr:hypothetical protein [Rubrivivax sp.]
MTSPNPAVAPTDAVEAVALLREQRRWAGLAPEQAERAQAEAFARLSSAERGALLERIAALLPPADRALAGPSNSQPLGLARLLTRLSARHPGLLDRLAQSVPPSAGSNRALLLAGLAGGVAGVALTGAAVAAWSAFDGVDAAAQAPDLAAGAGEGGGLLDGLADLGLG